MLRYQTLGSMTAIACPSMQQVPLLEVSGVVCKMRLTIKPLTLLRDLTHPTDLRTIHVQHLEILALLSQLLCHSFDIHLEIIPQELSDFGILMITHQRRSLLRIRRVYVHVCGGVAVCAPACLRTARDHVGVTVQSGQGRVGDGFDLLLCVIVDTEAVDYAVDDEDLFLLVRRRGEKVRGVFDGQTFGGVGGIGERCRVPDIVWIGSVEF